MIVEPAVAWQPKRNVVEMGPLISITLHYEPYANSLTLWGDLLVYPRKLELGEVIPGLDTRRDRTRGQLDIKDPGT